MNKRAQAVKCKQCRQPRPNHKLDCSHPDAQVDQLQNMVELLGARLAAWEPTIRAVVRCVRNWTSANAEAVWREGEKIPEEHRV